MNITDRRKAPVSEQLPSADRRINHLRREFIRLVESGITRGEVSAESGAEMMFELAVPTEVVAAVIRRAQEPSPVAKGHIDYGSGDLPDWSAA